MKNRTRKKYLLLLSAATICILGIFLGNIHENNKDIQIEKQEPALSAPAPLSHFTLITGDTYSDITFSKGENLYAAIMNFHKKTQFVFEGETYPGLGFLVTDIGSLHQKSGTYLFYFINSKEASVGVSAYVPNTGDVIEWKLK